jgi:hypothetical protein
LGKEEEQRNSDYSDIDRLVPSQLSEQTRKQRHKMAAHFIKSIEIERKFSEKQCNKVPQEKAYANIKSYDSNIIVP